MTASIHPLPVKTGPDTFDLEGWEILFASTLDRDFPSIPAAEKAAMAMEAGLPGVARVLSGIRAEAGLDRAADESADLIREAASRR